MEEGVEFKKALEEMSLELQRSPQAAADEAWRLIRFGIEAESEIELLFVCAKAYRLLHRFVEAKLSLFLAAQRMTRIGELAAPVEIDLLCRLSAVHRDAGEFDTAECFLNRAHRLAPDRVSQARIEVCAGRLLADIGNPSRQLDVAAQHLRRALNALSIDSDAGYLRSAWDSLIFCQTEMANTPSLRADLEEYLRVFPPEAETIDGAMVAWLEGVARRRLGEERQSRQKLEEARAFLGREGIVLYFALASLDLLSLEIAVGAKRRALTLAGEMFPVFRALSGHREAQGALRRVYEGAMAGTLSLLVIESARVSLREVSQSGQFQGER